MPMVLKGFYFHSIAYAGSCTGHNLRYFVGRFILIHNCIDWLDTNRPIICRTGVFSAMIDTHQFRHRLSKN